MDVFFLGLNSVVGGGIFLLPGLIASQTGPFAWSVYLGAALLCFLIALCFAEMGGMYDATGGAYLYSREAFGPFIGFLVGWVVWMAAILGWAAVVTGFVELLRVQPLLDRYVVLDTPWAKAGIVLLVCLGLSLLNVRGARQGAIANNVFSTAKLLPLLMFILLGLTSMHSSPFVAGPGAPTTLTVASYAAAMQLAIFMFSGFEWMAVPAGEMSDPQRQVPRALFLVLGWAALMYAAIHLVAQGTYPALATAQSAPLTHAAEAFMPAGLAQVVALGGLISILGVNASIAFTAPRAMYALARDGYLPRAAASIHPLWRTPWVAIGATAAIVLMLPTLEAMSEWLKAMGSPVPTFSLDTLTKMSALASLMQYIPTCLAVAVLRVRRPEAERRFRVPGGLALPAAALMLSVLLFAHADPGEIKATFLGLALGVPLYFAAKRLT